MSVAITFTDDELAAIGIQASKEYRDMQHGAIPLGPGSEPGARLADPPPLRRRRHRAALPRG